MERIPLVIIAGPTGVGKTDLSVELALKTGGEIVSCDSMQIYRGMDVGSAKITEEEKRGVPHHLIDIIEPEEEFSVAEYKELAERTIRDIYSRGRIPIMTGGTGLYINSVVRNFNFTESIKDDEIRKEMEHAAQVHGNHYVHNILKGIDPVAADEIHMNNLRRVIRAIEVTKKTGIPFSSQKHSEEMNPRYDVSYYYLNMDRKALYERIDRRVDIMMEKGLLEEVKGLKERGLTESHQSMQGIGYKEILAYLDGHITLSEAIDRIKQLSRNYAKRQLTWFRNDILTEELNKDLLSFVYMIEYIKNKIVV